MATKIVVDAGHGGSNPGAVYQGRRESDDALRLAMAVGRILEENGYDVSYTRTTREFDSCIIKKLLTGRIKPVFFCQVFCFTI